MREIEARPVTNGSYTDMRHYNVSDKQEYAMNLPIEFEINPLISSIECTWSTHGIAGIVREVR